MLSIKSSCTVKPNEPTPNVKLWLPECDQIKAYTHAPAFFLYRPEVNKSVSSPLKILKNSLSHALVSYYPLAGRLNWIGGGRFELHCNAMGVEILEAESEAEIKDLGDFRPTPETRKLVPSVDYTKDITELPIVLVQLTRFKCGGISIGAAASHIVVDGQGFLGFFRAWANIARGEKEKNVEPCHDRTVFYKGDALAKPHFDHVELKASPKLIGDYDVNVERTKETLTTMLSLSRDQVDKLKKKANQGRTKDHGSREYTRFEVLAAHIWRCVSKARRLQNEQLSSLRIAVDCRNRLRPPLPQGYYGNAIMVTTAVTKVGELVSIPLAYACGLIRKSVDKVNDDYIKSATDFLTSQPDLTPYRTGFNGLKVSQELFLGIPNLAVTSWFGLPLYDGDFGWGKPIFMGPSALGFKGRAFVIPGRDEEGSFIFPIRLQVDHVDDFQKFFYQDIDESN